MFPSLVADIGGTNARFALVTGEENNQPVIESLEVLDGSRYQSLQEAIRAYIELLGIETPKAACVAIAGPIGEDSAQMTNLNWSFTLSGVKQEFDFTKFEAINDFTALSIAASKLTEQDLTEVRPGKAVERGNKAILGPGTGLGVGGLVWGGNSWIPVPSEGGHANMPPATELECEVIKAAIEQNGHVSAEIFLSGPGLVRLYTALAAVRGEPAKKLEPRDVTENALNASDQLCVEALQLFCGFLGTLSGNLALTFGARGGVYIAGGIVPRFVAFLQSSDFNSRFQEKGVMSRYVADIPVNIMSHAQPGLLGAAAWITR